MNYSDPEFGILQPNKRVVELLFEYNFAKNMDGNVVISAIDFYFDKSGVKSRKNKKKIIFDDAIKTNYFDMALCSPVYIKKNDVFYQEIRNKDLKNYDKSEITSKTFKNIKTIISKNKKEFKNIINELNENMPDVKFSYEELMENGDELTDYLQELLNRDMLSYEKAKDIEKQLFEEYNSGIINDDTIDYRFNEILLSENKYDLDDLIDFNLTDHLLGNIENDKTLKNDFKDSTLSNDKDKLKKNYNKFAE